MNCPYLDCDAANIQGDETHCDKCRGQLKICKKCSTPNRSFAIYCRECGTPLPDSDTDWPIFKQSPQRLGVNRFVITRKFSKVKPKHEEHLRLPGRCRSLLVYDNYLFAISQGGEVKVVDISQVPFRELTSFNTGGNVYSVPALNHGSLYIGTEKSLHAYSLGNLFSGNSSVEPRWTVPVSATPVQSLLPVENRLLFTLAYPDRYRGICMISNIETAHPEPPAEIYKGSHLSSMAGHFTARNKKVYFLSVNGSEEVELHCIDNTSGSELVTLPVKKAPSKFRKIIPIAIIGASIFVVFRKEETLCRVDTATGEINALICKNVKDFVMAGINEPIVNNSRGLFFKRINRQAELEDGQTIRGNPLVLKDFALVVGMGDGNVHLYDIRKPEIPVVWDVSEQPTEKITALAASKNIIMAGNDKGLVKICRL